MTTPSAEDERARTIVRLVGIYNADRTIRGELAYFVGARLGLAHCGLCEITHGLARERTEWKTCRAGLGVAFDTFHRDDQPDAIRSATGNTTPVVVAETGEGIITLLGPADLDACGGSIEGLVESIDRAVVHAALLWPAELTRRVTGQ